MNPPAIPARHPYELKATPKQKNYLWNLGFQDQAIIDDLGKDQASALIDQLSRAKRGSGVGAGLLVSIILIGLVVFAFAAQSRKAPTTGTIHLAMPAAEVQRSLGNPVQAITDFPNHEYWIYSGSRIVEFGHGKVIDSSGFSPRSQTIATAPTGSGRYVVTKNSAGIFQLRELPKGVTYSQSIGGGGGYAMPAAPATPAPSSWMFDKRRGDPLDQRPRN